jgi:putative oxidoreductase
MSQFTSPAVSQTLRIGRGRTGLITLWTAQLGLAGMFLLAGGSKLTGAPAMVALFDAIGVGQWFRYVTGLIEVGSAVALLVPSLATFGAIALVATMAGAILTHLLVVGGSPAAPVILFIGSLVVAWARRRPDIKALSRVTESPAIPTAGYEGSHP